MSRTKVYSTLSLCHTFSLLVHTISTIVDAPASLNEKCEKREIAVPASERQGNPEDHQIQAQG